MNARSCCTEAVIRSSMPFSVAANSAISSPLSGSGRRSAGSATEIDAARRVIERTGESAAPVNTHAVTITPPRTSGPATTKPATS